MDTLKEEHQFKRGGKPQPRSHCGFPTGHTQVRWSVSFARGARVRTEAYIDARDEEWNKELFDELYREKNTIEDAFGEPLEWERLDDYRASRIAVYRDGSIDDDDDALKEIRHWMVDRLLKFRKVVGPRLDQLVK